MVVQINNNYFEVKEQTPIKKMNEREVLTRVMRGLDKGGSVSLTQQVSGKKAKKTTNKLADKKKDKFKNFQEYTAC